MKIPSICFAVLTTVITATGFAQTSSVRVAVNVVLPADTAVKEQLIFSLNDFLSQTGKPNRENTGVLPSELLETSVLLDEMKNLQKNEDFGDTNFYKPYAHLHYGTDETIFNSFDICGNLLSWLRL